MPVYFMQAGDDGPIRIGCAEILKNRRISIQALCPYPLHIRAAILHGGLVCEAWMQLKYRKYLLHGSWFEPSAEVLAEIERIKGGFIPNDIPPEVTGYKLCSRGAGRRRSGQAAQRILARLGLDFEQAAVLTGVGRESVKAWCKSHFSTISMPAIVRLIAYGRTKGIEIHPDEFHITEQQEAA